MKKLFKQEEINKAALNHSNSLPYDNDYESFKAGVQFVESKVEDIAIEFANWYSDRFGPNKEDFQQFIKEKYDE